MFGARLILIAILGRVSPGDIVNDDIGGINSNDDLQNFEDDIIDDIDDAQIKNYDDLGNIKVFSSANHHNIFSKMIN